jgi:hypothetical protein
VIGKIAAFARIPLFAVAENRFKISRGEMRPYASRTTKSDAWIYVASEQDNPVAWANGRIHCRYPLVDR